MEHPAKLRVTIWQPYFAGCMLAFPRVGESEFDLLDGDAELQKEVFTWPLQEDVWAGIVSYEVRDNLQSRFGNDFQPSRPPSERTMQKLAEFVTEVEKALTPGMSEWSVAESGAAEFSSMSFMINGLSALHNQLSWLLDMFRDLPGASVSVR